MKDADSVSSAACSQIGFGWRGNIEAMPLPRCVLSRAPASDGRANHGSGRGRMTQRYDNPGRRSRGG